MNIHTDTVKALAQAYILKVKLDAIIHYDQHYTGQRIDQIKEIITELDELKKKVK